MSTILFVLISVLITSIGMYRLGQWSVLHRKPTKPRCPAILGGLACSRCEGDEGHAGPHGAYWRGRMWWFPCDGCEITPAREQD